MANLRDVRREAVLQAELLLAELDIGPAERVRVFDVIEDGGVWLTFAPLERLYGWYQRVEAAAGIVINASHPVPLQRFTAAHELGHHLLGHSQSLDDERRIIDGGRGTEPDEVAAHTFAANLLMPLAAVEFHLARMGMERSRPVPTPIDVYRLAVELGVSYSAAAVQLASLNKIPWSIVPELRKVRPLSLKQRLGGRTPDYRRAAVWLLDDRDDGRHLLLDTGDELHLRLDEIRSSGYRWTPAPPTNDGFVLLDDKLEPPDVEGARYGTTQCRHLIFKATSPGSHSIVVDLRQPWDREAEPVRRFGVAADIESPRVSEVGRGVSVNQQQQLVAA
ncbi:MAG: ImmA/IrrE family metallo-endopeptidase [Actinomycetota bacterium]|nr:ImmA/IrrE family metallo-endopeptidase [Actinomycetota bacterium]